MVYLRSSYLSSCASHRQIAAVFTEVDLLNAQPRVITVRVKTANLNDKRNAGNLLKTPSSYLSDPFKTFCLVCEVVTSRVWLIKIITNICCRLHDTHTFLNGGHSPSVLWFMLSLGSASVWKTPAVLSLYMG